jgi:hypothetical protein
MNAKTTIQANIDAVQARLDGSPDTAAEWQTIARQLRTAADAARKLATLAQAMNHGYVDDERLHA